MPCLACTLLLRPTMLSESTERPVEAVWSPPEYDVLNAPQLGKKLEMTADSEWPNDFPRSAKWYVQLSQWRPVVEVLFTYF